MPLYFYPMPIGKIGIAEQDGGITDVYFETDTIPETAAIVETALLNEAFHQLIAYFAGELKAFDLPLAPRGTDFQCAVWQQLIEIPYGKTLSYKGIAVALNKPQAVRAVGQANSKNPLPIFIPCHRVINANGKLGGYSGGLAIKEYLLAVEQRYYA